MVKCDLCNREFKNTQGLSGHKKNKHSEHLLSSTPATETTSAQPLSKLEDRLSKVEYVAGVKEPSILYKYLYDEKPLPIQLAQVAEELSNLTQQVTSFSSSTEYREIKSQVTQQAQQLSSYSKWFQPVRTASGLMSRLEYELSNRAPNTSVSALENKFALLKEEQEKEKETVNQCVRNIQTIVEIPMPKILEVIRHMVDKSASSVKQLQSQLDEQKKVTDWVIKEYKLRPVKKVK